ncbi:MAG: CBS domain-containing protein [Phycisphaerales bacterium]|nr:CBS domain-containing protein [Phycisphaerales bacterium]
MLIQEYMTPDPLVVSKREFVSRIAELIRSHDVHQVPVVDEHNRLVGIITDRDICSATDHDESKEAALRAEDIMTIGVVSLSPGDDLRDALDILCRKRFGALPVVVGGHVVGILSSRDLLKRLRELLNATGVPSS